MFNAENAQFANVTELEINEMNLLVGGDGDDEWIDDADSTQSTATVTVRNPKSILPKRK